MGYTQSKLSCNTTPSAQSGNSAVTDTLPSGNGDNQSIHGKIADNNIYAIIVNALSEGIIMIDKTGKIQAWNSRAAEIFGLDVESNFLGRALLEDTSAVFDENGAPFKPDALPSYRTLVTGMPQFGTVIGIKQINGKVTWVSVNSMPVINNAETPDAVVLSITDITKERIDAIKLKQTQTLFSTFIANSKTAAWVYDEEGNILMSNAEYDRFTNASAPSAGKNIREIFPAVFAQKLLDINKEIFKDGVVTTSYNDMLQQDGSVKNMVSYLFTIQLPGGEKLIAGQALDLTEQYKATVKQKESQAIFGQFMKSVPILSWIYEPGGKLVYGNDRFFAETGMPESAIGKDVH
ncbi:MAG: PAS domain-containing protein [Chitinophagaceae bacterium]|nr:PAS domain-containing protein [Chitinophagaceae bacterium]